MDQPKHLSLFELNQQIRQSMIERFPESAWIIAEISEIKISAAGHCYIELIQKEIKTATIKAKASATIWAATFRMLRPYFEMTTGRPLEEGMKILIRVTVEFHEIYGFSLKVMDIDPTYTIGELELQRQQTIQQLIEDGVFEMNKQLPLPFIPQRLAIISSEKSAGYQDFMHQLKYNSSGYHVNTKLFNATMQGKEAEPSILLALDRIFEERLDFDAVVIIRGGGAQADLSCFDSYLLAFHIAQMPLPVITGIGHTKDISVADMVAHTSVKTPTAVAELILSYLAAADESFSQYGSWISSYAEAFISNANRDLRSSLLAFRNIQNITYSRARILDRYTNQLKGTVFQKVIHEQAIVAASLHALTKVPQAIIEKNNLLFKNLKSSILKQASLKIQQENRFISSIDSYATNLKPENLLKKGFSITKINGKVIKSIASVYPDDILETTLYDGTIVSKRMIKRKDW